MAQWFETWFDSPYYHILYSSRNDKEASSFIDALAAKLSFNISWLYCDAPCGKGRHAKYLNSLGYDAIGLDLSAASILEAQKLENPRLKFYEHDIRQVFKKNTFDIHLNLFTSFGYFDSKEENIAALQAMVDGIKPGGLMVLDYMNSKKAIENFQTSYIKTVDHIDFQISKYIEQGFIIKKIAFTDNHQQYEFYEKVKLLFIEDFYHYFKSVELDILHTYGTYALDDYIQMESPRMIFVCQKT